MENRRAISRSVALVVQLKQIDQTGTGFPYRFFIFQTMGN